MDLFVERRERTPGVELLVRANRVLGKDDTDKLKVSPAQGKRVVRRLSERIKASKQAARAAERQATVELRRRSCRRRARNPSRRRSCMSARTLPRRPPNGGSC